MVAAAGYLLTFESFDLSDSYCFLALNAVAPPPLLLPIIKLLITVS